MRFLLLWALVACKPSDVATGAWGDGVSPSADYDADGVLAEDDCNDFDAAIPGPAREICGNGEDDDCSGLVDCDDSACSEEADCVGATAVEQCFDGIDNDGDGKADCLDSDCDQHQACSVCDIVVSGTCGSNYNPWTAYFADNISDFSCGGGNAPEVVYEFVVLEDQDVLFRVDPEKGGGFGGNDVSIYVMEGVCYPETCIDKSVVGAVGVREEIVFTATANTYYYLVIEDVGGSSSDYDINVFCKDPE